MALEGRLRDLALSDVFQLLEFSRKSGTLTVRSELGDRTVVLCFDRGAITAAYPAGTAGPVDAPTGSRSARQVEELAAGLLQWADGHFRFEEGDGLPPAGEDVRIPAHVVLIEAARRADAVAPAAPPAPPAASAVPALGPELCRGASLDLEPSEWEVLALVDGERSVAAIAGIVGRPESELAPVIDGLLEKRLVAIPGSARTGAVEAGDGSLLGSLEEVQRLLDTRAEAEARRLVETLIALHPDDARVRLVAGRLLLIDGECLDAAEQLSRAVRLDPLGAEAHYFHGLAAARAGDLPRAAQAWGTFLRLSDGSGSRAAAVRRALEAVGTLRALLAAEWR
jgi:hypothetical protein